MCSLDLAGIYVHTYFKTELLPHLSKYSPPRGMDNCYPALDLFLLSQILHPSVCQLDMTGMTGIPTAMRNILIRNLSRMRGLRHLSLSTSIDIPWSMFFSQPQTSRFMSSIENIQTLVFQDYADDVFVMEIGQHCFNLGGETWKVNLGSYMYFFLFREA